MTESKKEALAQFHRKNILQAAQTLFAQKSFAINSNIQIGSNIHCAKTQHILKIQSIASSR